MCVCQHVVQVPWSHLRPCLGAFLVWLRLCLSAHLKSPIPPPPFLHPSLFKNILSHFENLLCLYHYCGQCFKNWTKLIDHQSDLIQLFESDNLWTGIKPSKPTVRLMNRLTRLVLGELKGSKKLFIFIFISLHFLLPNPPPPLAPHP